MLRGLGATPAELREASASRDVVFVPELRSHGRKRGPLVSLFAWWRCAVRAWPRAHFVGMVAIGPPGHNEPAVSKYPKLTRAQLFAATVSLVALGLVSILALNAVRVINAVSFDYLLL